MHTEKNETRPSFYTKHKNIFNNDETLNIRPETIKILEENLGSTAQSQTLVITIYFQIYFHRQREQTNKN